MGRIIEQNIDKIVTKCKQIASFQTKEQERKLE